MVSPADIIAYVDAIVAAVEPDAVTVFGSYAYATPTVDSDVDLLVIMDHSGPAHLQATAIRLQVPASFPLDLLVCSKATLATRKKANDFFLQEITKKGIVLYAAGDARVGYQGRKRLRRRLVTGAVAKAESV